MVIPSRFPVDESTNRLPIIALRVTNYGRIKVAIKRLCFGRVSISIAFAWPFPLVISSEPITQMALPLPLPHPASISVGRLNDRMKRELERKLLVDPLPPNRRQGSRFEERLSSNEFFPCVLRHFLIRLFDLLLRLFRSLLFGNELSSLLFSRGSWLLLLSASLSFYFVLFFYSSFSKTQLEILVIPRYINPLRLRRLFRTFRWISEPANSKRFHGRA